MAVFLRLGGNSFIWPYDHERNIFHFLVEPERKEQSELASWLLSSHGKNHRLRYQLTSPQFRVTATPRHLHLPLGSSGYHHSPARQGRRITDGQTPVRVGLRCAAQHKRQIGGSHRAAVTGGEREAGRGRRGATDPRAGINTGHARGGEAISRSKQLHLSHRGT